MKYTFLMFSLLLPTFALIGEDQFIARTGRVWFLAPTSVEDVEAESRSMAAEFNPKTGEIKVVIRAESFEFPTPLMKRHFIENYLESAKFPDPVFQGKLINIHTIQFRRPGSYPARVSGNLTIHGVTKKIEAECIVTVREEDILATGSFTVRATDFDIELPLVLGNDPIKINVQMTLTRAH